MQSRLVFVRPQPIGGLLNAIMHELVGAIDTLDQLKTNRLPQIRVDLLLRCPVHERERRDLGAVAEAGQLQQSLPCLVGQTAQLADHEVRDVLGVAFGVDTTPDPSATALCHDRMSSNPSSASAYRNWIRKNGLPPVFSCISCASGAARAGSQRSVSAVNCATLSWARGASLILLHPRFCVADCVEFLPQRMRGADLIVTIGADQQEMSQVRPDQ